MYVEVDCKDILPCMANPLIIYAHASLQSPLWSLVWRLCVTGNDFSCLWSKLRNGKCSEHVLYLNFIVEMKVITADKWSLFDSVDSGCMYTFGCM